MATIQVRDIPDEAYEVLRRRARESGHSLQSYMRARVIELAERTPKPEALARIEEILGHPGPGRPPSAESIVEDVASGRR